MNKYYFAYGSNMYFPRLASRLKLEVDSPEELEMEDSAIPFVLPQYKLVKCAQFVGIELNRFSCVHGVIYKVTDEQLLLIDRYEGFYYRTQLFVGREYIKYIEVYIPREDLRIAKKSFPMSKEYKSLLVQGAIDHSLHREWIEKLKRLK